LKEVRGVDEVKGDGGGKEGVEAMKGDGGGEKGAE
jgi:hypothetical protein